MQAAACIFNQVLRTVLQAIACTLGSWCAAVLQAIACTLGLWCAAVLQAAACCLSLWFVIVLQAAASGTHDDAQERRPSAAILQAEPRVHRISGLGATTPGEAPARPQHSLVMTLHPSAMPCALHVSVEVLS